MMSWTTAKSQSRCIKNFSINLLVLGESTGNGKEIPLLEDFCEINWLHFTQIFFNQTHEEKNHDWFKTHVFDEIEQEHWLSKTTFNIFNFYYLFSPVHLIKFSQLIIQIFHLLVYAPQETVIGSTDALWGLSVFEKISIRLKK